MADEQTLDTPQTPDAEAPEAPDAENEKLDQKVTLEDVGPARKKITIEVPSERIDEKIRKNLDDLKSEAVLPGFRRGRAPMRLIEKRFGTDVRNEVKSQLMAESYSQVIEENELRVVGEPDIKDIDTIKLPEEGPLTFEVEIEIVPPFELPDLKGLKVEKKKVDISDEQVDAEIQRYCEMQGRMTPVEGKVEVGDYLTADIEVRTEDGEVAESRQAATVYVPGESRKFKGVVAGIIVEDLGHKLEGRQVGDTVSLETTGPKQHENEALRDAKLTISVRITKAERQAAAEVDDLLKAFGFDSADELKQQIRSNLEQRAEAEQRADMQKQVTDAILEKIEFDLPEGLSGRQTERIVQRRAMEMMYRGASQQDIEEAMAELRASSEEDAQRELKLFFILDKYAEKFDVDVSESEINGRIAQLAVQSGRRPEKMRQEMARSGRLEQMYIQLREQKAIEQILQDAEVTEVEAPAADAEADAEAKPAKKTTRKKTTSKKKADDA